MQTTFAAAQSAYDNMRPQSESELPEIEPTDEHYQAAVDEMADPASLLDFLNESAWYKEHMQWLYDHSQSFAKEYADYLAIHSKSSLDANALKIAEDERDQRIEDARNDHWEE